MPQEQIQVDSLAEAYLALLKDRGVDYLFGNAGTDFASVIEALSKSDHRRHECADTDDGAARKPRGLHGAWLFPRHRQASGGNGPRQCGDRQRDLRHHQRRARERTDHLHFRTDAADRDRRAGRAVDLYPLGPGDVRPGGHGPRDGQVGLRAAQCPPAGDHRRPRRQRGDERAQGACLSHPAARGAGREARRFRL